jgi:two-component system sensor histidine kinase HydH
MIIKASLRTLRREDVRPDQLHAAVADIDEEIGRLNRIVSEVLDFARPIRFEYARAALNGICADAAEASARGAGQAPADIELDLAPEVGDVVTDPERLRIALVNILVNAQHAVQEAPHRSVRISTRRLDHGRVAIRVQDTGAGIAPDDLPNVFDPYFTTKRTGTGLGLAIARTIVQGLGGTIQVSSRQRQGTEIRIDLPAAAPGAAAAGAGGPADRSRTAQVS